MQGTYFQHPCRLPKNVDGPFYMLGCLGPASDSPESPVVWIGNCLQCGTPGAEAPGLLAPFDETYTDTYFVRQPVTPEETAQAIMAARVCCVSPIRYGGQDRAIIAALENDPAMCDYIGDGSGKLRCTVGPDGKLLPFAQAIVDEKRAELQRQQQQQNKKWWQFWR